MQVLGDEVDDEKAQAIKKFLSGLLEQMDSVAEVKVYLPEKGRYKVILEGQGLGALIGRRGETLDAIQQLTSYAVNRTGCGYSLTRRIIGQSGNRACIILRIKLRQRWCVTAAASPWSP